MMDRSDHWDLMLEDNGVLKTWEVPFEPSQGRHGRVRKLFDHRIEYLDFEGDIGQNRGHVTRIMSGTLSWIMKTENRIEVELNGDLHGRLLLEKIADDHHSQSETQEEKWHLELDSKDSDRTDTGT